ncbi:MAG TPA: TolC family protein [Kofleriaceae bacterium]|jgi:HAE1 family hydrophobic/amphiphilic exporter-1
MRSLLFALALLPRLAAADPPAPQKLTLDQVIGKAIANPKVQMALGDREAAAARVDEANAARLPHVKGTAFATISPEIQCQPYTTAGGVVLDAKLCVTTEPTNFAFQFSGVYGTAEIDVTQPLYTFGKIGHARTAARAGLDAQRALADEAAGDVAADAARAYWGLKLARELGGMLDDGIDEIAKAQKDFAEKPDATISDRQRVAVLLAEAKAQRAEAANGEAMALAGLRAVTGMDNVDIDDTELAPVDHVLADDRTVSASALRRPQAIAAKAGAHAADELADFEEAQYYPDIAVVGSAVYSHAQGVDDPISAFANDPYRREGAALGIGLQWTLEPWNTKARTDRARAEAKKQHAQAELADLGARFDAETARIDAVTSHDKLAAAAEGEKAARTWLAAVLQNEAIGTAESRDLADAYLAWFQMRSRWATAVFEYNVAVVRLDRATGEFRADGVRPR